MINPVKYTEFIKLIAKSIFCFTDLGGIQEEAIILKKRCLIPSNKTPHSFYLNKKANQLLDLRNKNFMSKIKTFQKSILKKNLKIFSSRKYIKFNYQSLLRNFYDQIFKQDLNKSIFIKALDNFKNDCG